MKSVIIFASLLLLGACALPSDRGPLDSGFGNMFPAGPDYKAPK